MDISMNLVILEELYGAERAARLIKDAGFSACDLFIDLDKSESRWHSPDYKKIAADLRATIESQGIKIKQTHAPFRFSANRWDEPDHFKLFVKTLEISSILGAKVCVVHPLHHMEYMGHEEEIYALNVEYYKRLVPYCDQFGIKVGVENMWQRHKIRGTISFDTCSTVPEFVRYIDSVDSEYVVACLDTGHVMLPDNRDKPADFIRALGHDRLKSLHVHDNDYKSDAHWQPYHGKLDWAEIAKALGEIDYEGDFTYEIHDNLIRNLPEALIGDALKYYGAIAKYIVSQIDDNRPK